MKPSRAERLSALAERLYGPKPPPIPSGASTAATHNTHRKAVARASGKLLTRPLTDADRRDWAEVTGWIIGKGGAA